MNRIDDRPYILGIDPGFSGALALYSVETKLLVECIDMPVKTVRSTAGKKAQRIDGPGLSFWLDVNREMIRGAIIEEVGSRPENAPRAIWSFGFGTGYVHGLVTANFIPIVTVKPQIWKMNLGLSKDKNLSRQRATVEFPNLHHYFLRAKDDGRAEAALLAKYGERIFAIPEDKKLI